MHESLNKSGIAIKSLLVAVSLFYMAVLVYLISVRIGYPFEIEWLEGDMLMTAIRLLEGNPIYQPPDNDYVSNIYPPIYYFVIAGFFKLLEPGLFALRLVSVLSIAGIFSIIFSVISRETKTYWLGILGLGFFSSYYFFHGSWYDVGRVDSFFYLMLLSAIYLTSLVNKYAWASVASSIMFCLAIFTKQSALVFTAFAFLYLFINYRRESFIFLLTLLFTCASAIFILQVTSDGWFAELVFFRPLSLPAEPGYIKKIIYEVITGYPVVAVISALFILAAAIRYKKLSDISIWEMMLIPAVISYIRVRPIIGSYLNDSIYLTVVFSLLIPIWLNKFILKGDLSFFRNMALPIMALLCVHFLLAWESPGKWIQHAGSDVKGRELIERLEKAEGPVFVHLHPLYAWMAGKEPHFNSCNLWAYNLPADSLSEPEYVATELYENVSNHYYSVIVLDDRSSRYSQEFFNLVTEYYELEAYIDYSHIDQLSTLTGFKTRPETIWVPRK